uniref:ABC transporter G family member 14-like n=1 Tax=Crassostrea virginica TaxID=6565 RepID=A0A8B8CVM5_CRAVI|nr:ABC transporter G family member 14-like [Crassostrea virginica]
MKTKASDTVLTFTDINLTLKEKEVLTDINGEAKSGQILAIMGPSGSGKTTLLNILAGDLTMKSGTITLNGSPLTKLRRRKMAYVLQSDIFLTKLTLRETLYFTAMIRLPDHVSKTNKMKRIDEIVDALHLGKCLDTIIGDFMDRGLSGGEKKRANIACELLTDPDIMLIDEPTSGLDSSTAHVLMEELKDFASLYNKTLLVTIHQPSSQIFHMFSTLLLLVNGHAAYFGAAQKALIYFRDIGLSFPDHYNPSDILLELLTTDEEIIHKIIEESKNKRKDLENKSITEDSMNSVLHSDNVVMKDKSYVNGVNHDAILCIRYQKKKDTPEVFLDAASLNQNSHDNHDSFRHLQRKWPTSFWTQFKMLAWRNAKQSRWRIFDERILTHSAIVAVFYCIIYYQIPQTTETLRDRMGAVYFPLMFWGFAMVTDSVTSFIGEREVVIKERKAGAYRLSCYYLAKMVSELPMLIILPIVQLSAMYWLSGIGGPVKFVMYIGINLLNCFTNQSLGYIIGACLPKFKYSITAANTIMVVYLLLGGFFNTHFPSWFTWAKYVSFLFYPFAAMMTLFFGDIEPFRCGNSNMYKNCHNETDLVTGDDVLQSVGIDIPVYCSISMMVVLILVLRIMGYYTIKFRLR